MSINQRNRQIARQARLAHNPLLPSDIKSQPVGQRTFRFQAIVDIATVSITVGHLFGLSLAVATTTTSTSAVSLFNAVRLRRVVVWGTGTNAASTNQSMSLQYRGGLYGINTAITAMGTEALPAHISSVPPEDSDVALWKGPTSATNDVLFVLNGLNAGNIVDIHVDYVIGSPGSAIVSNLTPTTGQTMLATIVTASPSGLYVGRPNTNLSPLSLPSVVVTSIVPV